MWSWLACPLEFKSLRERACFLVLYKTGQGIILLQAVCKHLPNLQPSLTWIHLSVQAMTSTSQSFQDCLGLLSLKLRQSTILNNAYRQQNGVIKTLYPTYFAFEGQASSTKTGLPPAMIISNLFYFFSLAFSLLCLLTLSYCILLLFFLCLCSTILFFYSLH